MSKKQDQKDAMIEKYSKMSRSELHAESIRIGNAFVRMFPDTYKNEILKSEDLKIIKQLLKK